MSVPKKSAKAKASAQKSPEISSLAQGDTLIEELKYDSIPYDSYTYPQTHPDKMYTIAKLFQLKPPAIEKSRILEIGCAGGANLAPVALAYPKAQCMGIDISSEQIHQANTLKKDLNLKNIDFRQADIARLDKEIGKFDYIMCHGVFSWVPERIQDAILKFCRDHLNENGLAVISYNVLPGWGAVKTLRDMMMYHTKNFTDPKQQIQEARNLLGFLYENTPGTDHSYKSIIEREMKILKNTNDSYVFHEHLETENHQFYLHQFVEKVQNNDLAYVSDTELSTMYLGNFNEKIRNTLGAIKDIVRQEQYIDFIINRRFRHSIITPAKNAANLHRNLKHEDIMDFYVAANFKPEQTPNTKIKFKKNNSNNEFTVSDEQSEIILCALAKKAIPMKIKDLVAEVQKNPQHKNMSGLDSVFLKNGLSLMLQNFITLSSTPPAFDTSIAKKPRAYSFARYQATLPNAVRVTNMKMTSLNIDSFTRVLLPLLDGTNTFDMLVKKMIAHVKNGDLNVSQNGKAVTDENILNDILPPHTESILSRMASLALLEKQ